MSEPRARCGFCDRLASDNRCSGCGKSDGAATVKGYIADPCHCDELPSYSLIPAAEHLESLGYSAAGSMVRDAIEDIREDADWAQRGLTIEVAPSNQ